MPNLIDLYAGAGGLSLGAARAGFKVAAAVETDPLALDTHKKNFPNVKHLDRDVSGLKGETLLEIAAIKKGGLDGLIGGPPCQGFSGIGKRRTDDKRNELFMHFFRLVKETRPKFFFVENVPGILDVRYKKLREEAIKLVGKSYTLLDPIKAPANEYGVPTTRTRVFFIGYQPRYFSNIDVCSFSPKKEVEVVCVRDALLGLPLEISPNWQSEESGWQSVGNLEKGWYAERIIGHIPPSVGHHVSVERYIKRNEVSGCLGTRHSIHVAMRYAALRPGERDGVSKAAKLKADGFCPTLRAGTGYDKGRYQAVRPIHYSEPRVITPREAARLQGFPDWFIFHTTKWHSFRQIGNSVSPLVAEHMLKIIIAHLLDACN